MLVETGAPHDLSEAFQQVPRILQVFANLWNNLKTRHAATYSLCLLALPELLYLPLLLDL